MIEVTLRHDSDSTQYKIDKRFEYPDQVDAYFFVDGETDLIVDDDLRFKGDRDDLVDMFTTLILNCVGPVEHMTPEQREYVHDGIIAIYRDMRTELGDD